MVTESVKVVLYVIHYMYHFPLYVFSLLSSRCLYHY